jgi:hypothetical protein
MHINLKSLSLVSNEPKHGVTGYWICVPQILKYLAFISNGYVLYVFLTQSYRGTVERFMFNQDSDTD